MKIKPCPFCGSDEIEQSVEGVEHNFLYCLSCGATGPDYGEIITIEKAVELWNIRAHK